MSKSVLMGLLCTTVIAGCGEELVDAPPMVPVSGTVSYNGEPVKEGNIRFVPAQGTKGPVSSAPIKDGAYSATAKGGVPVGSHKVEITALRAAKGAASNLPPELVAQRGGQTEQYLPAKFNTKTTLEIKLDGGGPVTENFELKD